jgi:hypothetical protein
VAVSLIPSVRLASAVVPEALVAKHVHVAAKVGANPEVKVGSLMRSRRPAAARRTRAHPPGTQHGPGTPDDFTRSNGLA